MEGARLNRGGNVSGTSEQPVNLVSTCVHIILKLAWSPKSFLLDYGSLVVCHFKKFSEPRILTLKLSPVACSQGMENF